jgi:pimeloyl-ACP methyl ester carboxylesterase
MVYHPINKKSKGVIDFLPTAHLDKYGGGSDVFYAIEGMLVYFGYTVIMADLIGSGTTKDLPIPFLMAENTGRVAYDMRRAAAQYLWDEFRYQLPTETTIMGYSLGGSAALAAQKYYETHHSHTVMVKEVHSSSGTNDLPSAFAAFTQTGISDYPAIPNTIYAFDRYYDLNIDYTQIFKGALLDHYDDWLSGAYSADDLREIMGTHLRTYMHDDFFKPFDQQNQEFKKLHPLLKENSLSEGWRPKAPIYMTHCFSDSYVPIESARETVKKLRRAGANISFMTYPGTHLTVGYLFFLRAALKYM